MTMAEFREIPPPIEKLMRDRRPTGGVDPRRRPARNNIKVILKDVGYMHEAEPRTFKNTNVTLHRLTKTEGDDYLTIDILIGHEERHKQIIESAIIEETEFGPVAIATRDDLIWMKRFRNSPQDIVDIMALENDKNTKND